MTAPTAGKGIESAIKHLLTDEYKFLGGERVQEMLAKDIIHLFRRYTRDPWSLDVGQTLWFAVDKDEKPGPAKTLAKMRIVPVVLSVTHDEDKVMRAIGCSHKEVRRFKVARILKEAYSQNGVLSQSDVSELLGVSAGTIGKDIREHQDENAVILPYRGTIHDIGPSLPTKKNYGSFVRFSLLWCEAFGFMRVFLVYLPSTVYHYKKSLFRNLLVMAIFDSLSHIHQS